MAARRRLTPNQVVAHNLRRARTRSDLTQAQAAEKLEPYLGERWSVATFSAAEQSFEGKRIRQFDADEIVAFSLAFELPVAFFFIPPPGDQVRVGAPGARTKGALPAAQLVDRLILPSDEGPDPWMPVQTHFSELESNVHTGLSRLMSALAEAQKRWDEQKGRALLGEEQKGKR